MKEQLWSCMSNVFNYKDFSSISREFRDIQWDLLFCLENTLPIVGTMRGKNGNKLSPIAVGNVIQWERAETHREASGRSPIDLNGSWTMSHKASETFVGKKVYCKTERWEWRNAWISKLCGSSRVSAKTCWSKCKVNGQADFIWFISVCLCLEERFVSLLAATARKCLFIMQIIAAAFLLSYAFCNWYTGFYTKLWWGLGHLAARGHAGKTRSCSGGVSVTARGTVRMCPRWCLTGFRDSSKIRRNFHWR